MVIFLVYFRRIISDIEPAKPDRIKQLEYEADQKALAECLNYSIDVAYRTGDR